MSIIYRTEKGSPLTSQEIDGNFKELETRITQLEDHPEAGESLGKISVEGDQISFTGSFGTDFGSFTLPKAALSPRGTWVTQTSYKELDLVTSENALHCCIHKHISVTWEQDRSYWKCIFSLPPPPSSTLSLYEKASLPEEEAVGKLALLLEEGGTSLIYFNGNQWQRLLKGDTL